MTNLPDLLPGVDPELGWPPRTSNPFNKRERERARRESFEVWH